MEYPARETVDTPPESQHPLRKSARGLILATVGCGVPLSFLFLAPPSQQQDPAAFEHASSRGSIPLAISAEADQVLVRATAETPSPESVVGQSDNRPPKPGESSESPSTTVNDQLSPEDRRLAKLIVGNWEQERFGRRLLTVKADGTGTMIILPTALYAFAFGKRIDINMFWSIKDGKLDYGITDGTPQDKVDLAAKSWGDHWVEKIDRLNENELVLINVTGGLPSLWIKAERDSPPEISAPR